MKKQTLLALLLAGACAFSSFALTGCGDKEASAKASSSESSEETTEAPKELSLPVSSSEVMTMDYENLYDMFREAGFTNVDYNGMDDLKSSSDEKNETIAKVTVDGKSTFEQGDSVMSDKEIQIYYHSVKKEWIPVSKYDLEHEDMYYEDVITQIESKGFTNVSTRAVEDASKDEGVTKEIIVNGESDGSSYAPIDSKIVVVYYTKKAGESKQESKAESKADAGVVTPSFKETMDSYEAFFDEYIAFMKKYQENPGDMSLLSEYTDYLTKYSEYLSKLNSIDTDSLSAADMAYYTEVNARILKKLEAVG